MVITYKFNDGTLSVVEVDDEIGSFIVDSRKAEHANDEKQRSHCYSSDETEFEGKDYADSENVESYFASKEFLSDFYEIYDTLTEVQKMRVEMLGVGLSMREIARKEKKDIKTIRESILAVRQKFSKKF